MRKHLLVLTGLMAVAALLHGWSVATTVVPARDTIGFVAMGQRLQQSIGPESLREGPQHPLFPLLTAAVHQALVVAGVPAGPERWCLAAQVVASIASVLLLVPFYFAGVRLFNARIAVGATALMAVLPAMVRIGSDGLSDSTHLLFFMTGFCCAQEFIATRRTAWLLAAGAASGLAYLTRPEGLVLAAALVLTLIAFQLVRSYRLPRRTAALGLVCLTAGTLAVAAPYAIAIGELTPKSSLGHILDEMDDHAQTTETRGSEQAAATVTSPSRSSRATAAMSRPTARESRPIPTGILAQVPPSAAGTTDVSLPQHDPVARFEGYGGASWALLSNVVEAMHYVLALAALVGMILPLEKRPRAADIPVFAVLVLFVPAVIQFASNAGYLSNRHVLVVASLGLFWASYGGWRIAGWMAAGAGRIRRTAGGGVSERLHARACPRDCRGSFTERLSPLVPRPRQTRFAVALLVASAVFCLPRALQPLHGTADGHRDASRWLALQTAPETVVLDTHGWASFFAGRTAYRVHEAQRALQDPRLRYIVIENVELAPSCEYQRALARLVEAGGEQVAEFPCTDDDGRAVLIYRWYPERLRLTSSG